MFPPRQRGGHEDDLPRAYPHLRDINGIDPVGLRILMDEDPGQVRHALEEDLRRFADHNDERLRDLRRRGMDEEEIGRVRRVMRNEYELRKRENEAHLAWVWRNVSNRSLAYRIRRSLRVIKRAGGR